MPITKDQIKLAFANGNRVQLTSLLKQYFRQPRDVSKSEAKVILPEEKSYDELVKFAEGLFI